jgi:hypothetical protein
MSAGAVRVAKCRVLHRVRQELGEVRRGDVNRLYSLLQRVRYGRTSHLDSLHLAGVIMAARFTCPHCHTRQQVDPDFPPENQDCIRCGKSLVDAAFADHPLRRHRLFEEGNPRELETDFEKPAHVPGTVIAAGILWILFGSLQTLGILCGQSAGRGRDDAVADRVNALSQLSISCGLASLGVVFIILAARCVRGTAKDVLGMSVASLIFGVLHAVMGVVALIGNVAIGLIVFFLFAVPPCLAAVLALVGRKKYTTYRRATEWKQPRRRLAH